MELAEVGGDERRVVDLMSRRCLGQAERVDRADSGRRGNARRQRRRMRRVVGRRGRRGTRSRRGGWSSSCSSRVRRTWNMRHVVSSPMEGRRIGARHVSYVGSESVEVVK